MLPEAQSPQAPGTPPVRIADILSPARVLCDAAASSKKGILERLSALIAADLPEHSATEIFDSLIARERLGSTGVGHGVAIPHGRLSNCAHAYGAFIRSREPVDFDAIDRQPVDLFFALLVPEEAAEAHLQLLSELASTFSDARLLERLRADPTAEGLFKLLTDRSPDA